VRSNAAPRNLANAFETALRPRKDESLTRKSAEELVKKARLLQQYFGDDGATFILNPIGAQVDDFGDLSPSLDEFLNKVIASLKE